MLCDLHIHTYYSDGVFSPEEVVEQVLSKGIKLISITDHNSLEAYPEINRLCAENDVELITGVEIDCLLDGKRIHVLGYGFDLEDRPFQDMLEAIKNKVDENNKQMIYNMSKDYEIDLKEYEDFYYNVKECGFANFDYLIKKGYVKGFEDMMPLFKKYAGDIDRVDLPDFRTVVETIHKAGGKAVLAHPHDVYGEERIIEWLDKAVESGVDGIECYCPSNLISLTDRIVQYARDKNLLITGGCDAHGGLLLVVGGIEFSIGVIDIEYDSLNLGSMHKND